MSIDWTCFLKCFKSCIESCVTMHLLREELVYQLTPEGMEAAALWFRDSSNSVHVQGSSTSSPPPAAAAGGSACLRRSGSGRSAVRPRSGSGGEPESGRGASGDGGPAAAGAFRHSGSGMKNDATRRPRRREVRRSRPWLRRPVRSRARDARPAADTECSRRQRRTPS